jgi:SAM-dependent methyltransferase
MAQLSGVESNSGRTNKNEVRYAFSEGDPDLTAVQAFATGHFAREPSLRVHPNDEMFAFGLEHGPARSCSSVGYFRGGLQILSLLREIVTWQFGGFDKVRRILDFASGYGRSTRFLAAEIGPEKVWAGEILPEAVSFQASEFGVHSIQSTVRPEHFRCGESFDCIFVSSLFSHLPEATFGLWLERLFALLTPGGVLIFSVHGEGLMPPGIAMPPSGIWFNENSEIPSLNTADYGVTIVTDGFVRRQIEALTGQLGHYRIERGLCRHQDVYIVSNRPLPHPAPRVMHDPDGFLDRCVWTRQDELVLTGWALDINIGHSVKEIQLFLNGELCGTTENSTERPDIVKHIEPVIGAQRAADLLRSGWQCAITPKQTIRPFSDLLLAKAVSTTGKDFVLRSGVLDTMLEINRRA